MHHRGKPAKNSRSVAAGSPDGAVLGVAPYGDLEQRYRSLVADQSFKLGILQTIDGLFKGKLDPAMVSQAPVGADDAHSRAGHHSRKRLIIALSIVLLLLSLSIANLIFALQPKSVAYSFGQEQNCTDDTAILPNLFSPAAANGYKLTREPSLAIGGMPVITKNLCVTPTAEPVANSSAVQKQMIGVGPIRLSRSITVKTAAYPTVVAASKLTKLSQSDQNVAFQLSQVDQTFDYRVTYKDKTADCTKDSTAVTCPTVGLNLSAGSQYDLSLQRRYGDQMVGTATTAKVQTAAPLKITQTSVAEGATVNATLQQITVTADRPLAAAASQKVALAVKDATGKASTIPVKLAVSDTVLTISFDQKLPQPGTAVLTIQQLTGTDKSGLAQTYTVNFKTAGGPAVISSTLKDSGMDVNQAITITFDQPLAAGQNPIKLAVLSVNGTAQRAAYSLSGSTITLKPTMNYPKCSVVSVRVTSNVQNTSGQSGSSAWTGSGKVGC